MATMLSASSPTCKTPFPAQRLSCTNPTASILNWVSFFPKIPQNPMTLSIECSSRPRKKGAAHHNKTRPKKHSLSDKKRQGPTYYPPLERPPSYYPPLPRALNPFTTSEQKGQQPPPAVSSANAEQSPSSVVVPEVL